MYFSIAILPCVRINDDDDDDSSFSVIVYLQTNCIFNEEFRTSYIGLVFLCIFSTVYLLCISNVSFILLVGYIYFTYLHNKL